MLWKLQKFLGVFLFIFFMAGCHTITHEYSGDKQLTPGTKLTKSSQKIGDVKGERKAMFVLLGLIPINSSSGAELVDELAKQKYSNKYDGITKIRISEKFGVLDVILNTLIGAIFSMATVEVEGEVHQFQAGEKKEEKKGEKQGEKKNEKK
jgi:hypothetical protein